MHVHIEGGGVVCNILLSACLYLFPSQLLFFCIYDSFLPLVRKQWYNSSWFLLWDFCLCQKEGSQMSFFFAFYGFLLLMNRRGRETTVWLVCFSRKGLEFGCLATPKQRQKCQKVVEITSLTWAEWPEDVVPKVKWLSLIYGFTGGIVVSNQEAAGICQSSDVNADYAALLCPDCRARAQPKLNRADRTRSSRVEQ